MRYPNSMMLSLLTIGFLSVAATLVVGTGFRPTLLGGFDGEKLPDTATQALADSVRNQVVQKLGARDRITQFKVVSVKTQVVAGWNYRMKIQIGSNEFIHVQIFVPLPYTQQEPQVVSVQSNKKRGDPL